LHGSYVQITYNRKPVFSQQLKAIKSFQAITQDCCGWLHEKILSQQKQACPVSSIALLAWRGLSEVDMCSAEHKIVMVGLDSAGTTTILHH
jgi:hypothetical protein